jgi:hypothetical protein
MARKSEVTSSPSWQGEWLKRDSPAQNHDPLASPAMSMKVFGFTVLF